MMSLSQIDFLDERMPALNTMLYITVLMRSFFPLNTGFSLSDYNILYVLFIWSWSQNNYILTFA